MVANPNKAAKEQIWVDPTTLYGEEMVTGEMETHLRLQSVPDDRASSNVSITWEEWGYVIWL